MREEIDQEGADENVTSPDDVAITITGQDGSGMLRQPITILPGESEPNEGQVGKSNDLSRLVRDEPNPGYQNLAEKRRAEKEQYQKRVAYNVAHGTAIEEEAILESERVMSELREQRMLRELREKRKFFWWFSGFILSIIGVCLTAIGAHLYNDVMVISGLVCIFLVISIAIYYYNNLMD